MIGWTLLLCLLGMACLCLAMPKHFEAASGRKPAAGQTAALRLLGWGGLLLALWPAARAAGPSVGLALWAAALTPAGCAAQSPRGSTGPTSRGLATPTGASRWR